MRFSRFFVDLETDTKHCGSGLARDSDFILNINVDW
jgi:hypothetical protein